MLTTVLALDEVVLESSLCSVALNIEFPEIGHEDISIIEHGSCVHS
jgi:hypothetical protein